MKVPTAEEVVRGLSAAELIERFRSVEISRNVELRCDSPFGWMLYVKEKEMITFRSVRQAFDWLETDDGQRTMKTGKVKLT